MYRWASKAMMSGGIIAVSFARIFFRNAINIGLPILECPEAVKGTENGDQMDVDLSTGTITNRTRNQTYCAKSFPAFLMELIEAGGLIEYTRKRLMGQ